VPVVPDRLVELPDGDITPLLPFVDDALFINLSPGVEADEVPPRTALTHVLGNRGPTVPLATWTPGEIGIQHMAGPRVTRFLAERGCAVPESWYVVDEHPKRGLVVKTYDTPAADSLAWLVEACRRLCPLEIPYPWQAVVRTR
jgi:hypothetical protein